MIRTVVICAFLFCSVAVQAAGIKVTIVTGPQAPALEKLAAEQLAKDVKILFDAETMSQTALPGDGSHAILLGSPATNPAISADAWPDLSDQGHVLRSTGKGLIVGGKTPVATQWAVSELAYHFGMRHLLHGDFPPLEKPALNLEGINQVIEPLVKVRAWSAFNDQPHSALSWSLQEQERLITQLAKLKFTHFVLPAKLASFPSISLEGDVGGRAAFKGAKSFAPPKETDLRQQIEKAAIAGGFTVVTEAPVGATPIALGAKEPSVLPQFALTKLEKEFQGLLHSHDAGFVATAVLIGDLNPAVHYVSRTSFDSSITAGQSLEKLVTPICGEEVSTRLWMGFQKVEQAAALIAANDPSLGVPDARMFLRHLEAKQAPPAWLTEVKTLYTGAMNEMYRGNTRARGGARPFILYHAKRFEFALHTCTSFESLRKAGVDEAIRVEASEQGLEAAYNSLNAYADVARDTTDRASIALLNEYGYRLLLKKLEE